VYYKVYQRYKNFDNEGSSEAIDDESRISVKGYHRVTTSSFVKSNGAHTTRTSSEFGPDYNLRFSCLTNSKSEKRKYRNYYAPKCICLISVYPFLLECSKILKTIYKFSKSTKLKKPIEKIIENLVIEVPVPPRGLFSVEYNLLNEKYILTQSQMNKLPSLSLEFEKIFLTFTIEQVLEILKHILLETRIIFFSSDIANLTPLILGITSLIFPLQYPFQLVTILPKEDYLILESITPYIVGINTQYKNSFFAGNRPDISDITILIVDVDNRKIDLLSPFLKRASSNTKRKKFLSEEYPDLPKHYKKKLEKKLSEYLTKVSKQNSKEDRDSFVDNVKDLFFQFMVSILLNYNKYLNSGYYTNNDIGVATVCNLFKSDEFLESVDTNDKNFYKKLLLDTQMFNDFLYKRMIPKDSKEKLEILFFDENIIEKKNRTFLSRKQFTPFLHSNMYEIKNTYVVQKHRPYSETEIELLKDPKNQKEALRFGQDIFVDGDEIVTNYQFFPTLNVNLFFTKASIKSYFIPPNLSDDLESINIEIVSSSHLSKYLLTIGNVCLQQSEMENYIYLCWIQLWAMTLWYQDEIEKRYRFQQLLGVLDKIRNHEMETFNLLFECLSKYGEDMMILKLYERLLHYRLNPSFSICSIVMRLIDKKQINSNNASSFIKYIEKVILF
jgi:hypothetical protein